MKHLLTKLAKFLTSKRKEAIADILEKLGTAFIIAVLVSGFISDKGTSIELVIAFLTGFFFLIMSIILRDGEEVD